MNSASATNREAFPLARFCLAAMAACLSLVPIAAGQVANPEHWPHADEIEDVAQPIMLDRFDSLGGDFSLTNHDGRAVRLSDFRGEIVLLFFGYTHCPDACPLTAAKVAQAMSALGGERERVRFLFVTTDPERDSAARLKSWLAKFDAEFVGLRGPESELAPIEKRYGVFHQKIPEMADRSSYEMNHTSRLFLIDQQGLVRYLFRPEQPSGAIVDGVRQLLRPMGWWERVLDFSWLRE